MSDSLGESWSSYFSSFEPIPFAAASLGQVHSAILAGHVSPTGQEEKVAVKIQFPDIAKSIESDLSYLKLILNAGRMLPRGLFLDKTLQVMKGELADECDYKKEADSARFFGSDEGVGRDARFKVPWIWGGSTERVLVMQNMEGVSVGGSVVDSLSQESRDQVCLVKNRTGPTIDPLWPDCRDYHRAVLERAFRVTNDADRSELVEFPLE